jgi:hypothetical protein
MDALATPWTFAVAIITYIGGVLTKPFSDYINHRMLRQQIRVALHGEIAALYENLLIFSEGGNHTDVRRPRCRRTIFGVVC